MALDSLKVKSAPKAFSELTAKFNALVELIGLMRGTSGITVNTSEGGLVFSQNPTGIGGGGSVTVSEGGGGGNGNYGAGAYVVTELSTICLVPNIAPAVTDSYPLLLRVGNNSTNFTLIQENSVQVSNSTNSRRAFMGIDQIFVDRSNGAFGMTATVASNATMGVSVFGTGLGTGTLTPNAVVVASGNYSASLRAQANEGLYIQRSGGATYLYIQENAITRIMGVKTLQICNGNVSSNILVIASDPF